MQQFPRWVVEHVGHTVTSKRFIGSFAAGGCQCELKRNLGPSQVGRVVVVQVVAAAPELSGGHGSGIS